MPLPNRVRATPNDPFVDALFERVIFVTDRDDLLARPGARPGTFVQLLRHSAKPQYGAVACLLEQVRHPGKTVDTPRYRHRFMVDRQGEGSRTGRQVERHQLSQLVTLWRLTRLLPSRFFCRDEPLWRAHPVRVGTTYRPSAISNTKPTLRISTS